jgi:hypothetical protein
MHQEWFWHLGLPTQGNKTHTLMKSCSFCARLWSSSMTLTTTLSSLFLVMNIILTKNFVGSCYNFSIYMLFVATFGIIVYIVRSAFEWFTICYVHMLSKCYIFMRSVPSRQLSINSSFCTLSIMNVPSYQILLYICQSSIYSSFCIT